MRYPALCVALLAALAFPQLAFAQMYTPQSMTPQQGAKPDFDQYPSFIQVTTNLQDGTQVLLRCGYVQNGNTINADPGYMEMVFLNNNSYMRYQRIDNQIMMTIPAQGVQGRFMLEVVEQNGAVAAKNCATDVGSDNLQSCTDASPFVQAQQAIASDQNAANQCGNFLSKAGSQLNLTTYNAAKTDTFKNTLRQKARLLLNP